MTLRAALHSAALLALLFPLAPTAASAQISLSVQIAPPPLPIYVQPEVPGEGYLWTPGYWAWGDDINEYYWVPGTWVLAPQPGYLWTPGYWGFYGGGYRWNIGYWGSSVGFYGGVNYGFGYGGRGFEGGRWDRGVFRYNRSVTNVNVKVIHNVYIKKVVFRPIATHTSFNGGPNGVRAQPTVAEQRVVKSRHIEPTAVQVQHEQAARKAPEQRASTNHGQPQVAATPKPADLKGPGAVPARADKPGRADAPPRENPPSRADRPARAEPPAKVDAPARTEAPARADRPDRLVRDTTPARTAPPPAPMPENSRPERARPEQPRGQPAPQATQPQAQPQPGAPRARPERPQAPQQAQPEQRQPNERRPDKRAPGDEPKDKRDNPPRQP